MGTECKETDSMCFLALQGCVCFKSVLKPHLVVVCEGSHTHTVQCRRVKALARTSVSNPLP